MLSNARLYSSDITKRLNWLRVTVDSADLQTASPFKIVGVAWLKARLVNFQFRSRNSKGVQRRQTEDDDVEHGFVSIQKGSAAAASSVL